MSFRNDAPKRPLNLKEKESGQLPERWKERRGEVTSRRGILWQLFCASKKNRRHVIFFDELMGDRSAGQRVCV